MSAPFRSVRTPRLELRPLRIDDVSGIFAIRSDREAMRFWDWPGDDDVEQTRAVVEAMLVENAAATARYYTATNRQGTFVGLFDLSEVRTGYADLGFMVAREAWGRGYAKEACTALIDVACNLGVLLLKARIHAGNQASRHLLTNLGFQPDGTRRRIEVIPGRWIDCDSFTLEVLT